MNNISLSDLQDSWTKDCKIDDIELDKSSLSVPTLHAKYSGILADKKLSQIRYENKFKELYRDKWLWYTGKMSKEELDEREWEYDPFKGLTVLKSDFNKFFEADNDIQRLKEKIEYTKVTVEYLQDVVSQLIWRHQTIKNIIEWRKFMAGS